MNDWVIRFSRVPAVYLLVVALLILNIAKFWGSFLLGLNHQLLTLVQTILPIFILILVWKNKNNSNVTKIAWVFIFYHTARLTAELLVLALTDFSFALFVGIAFSYVRVMVIFALFMLLCMRLSGSERYVSLLIAYFLYTSLFSILQLPFSPVSAFFGSYGGNITSGNGLGYFRSNGGLGGTVIMYSNYLISTFLLLYYGVQNNKKVQGLLWCVFLGAVLLCFSRSLFVSIFIVVSVHFCVKKPVYFLVVGLMCSVVLILNWAFVFETYTVMTGGSDVGRISSWRLILQDFNMLGAMVGYRAGANTGLFIEGARKITADGFLLSWYYDYGLVGLGLFLSLLWKAICETGITQVGRYAIFLSLMLMMFVNSGFDKMFIVVLLFVTLMVLKAQTSLVSPRMSRVEMARGVV